MVKKSSGNERNPVRSQARSDEIDFATEQAKLGTLWTFLGFETDIPNENDWFRTRLGGRSIFVQRFGTSIRGFENRCAHRFFPLRTEERGNGPIVCGFHHWRYNADGLALGIPKCMEMFGKSPREMDARLEPVEIATCGAMIFGRFGGGEPGTLNDWLGSGYDILAHLAARSGEDRTGISQGRFPALQSIDRMVKSHWKLLMQISLDEYHIVAVHPTTFGKDGYLAPTTIRYFRFGAHSAYMPSGTDTAFADMARECSEGRYLPHRYRVFQFFPNLIVIIVKATTYLGEPYWYLLVQRLIPEEKDRTRSITRFFPLPFAAPARPWRSLACRLARPWINLGFLYYSRKVHLEDNVTCEMHQTATGAIDRARFLARQEVRVGWFEEEYARYAQEAVTTRNPAVETSTG